MKKLIPFLGLLFLTACDKKEEEVTVQTSGPDVPLVTGFEYRDELGTPVLHVGLPNIKIQESNISLTCYPNPTQDRLNIILGYSYSTPVDSNAVKHIWITAARIDATQPQLNFAGSYTPATSGQPLIEYKNLPPHTNNIKADLSALPAGAYRVYAQIGNVLLWDNIHLQK
ncbi:hypothetical protein [Adhaeribacter soli]|uniref:T9SS type A sorting domain-containing protein n=1 Tax=Adhaeribacter soli TaxID=2607655 RepID=A0A5N1IUV1_9BACT|nr:hypothetical protein [Adhaeribacter soli]KAA9331830.1 hypothetical protein F0P94_13605 [Adhaeribacter soli]